MITPAGPALPAEYGEKPPWPALWSMVIGFFMILVDSTIVSIATPALMESFGADISTVLWVTSAYLLAYAVPMLIAGRMGDRYGPKRLYQVGLVVFTLASLWCGLSTSIEMLIAARVLQGLGAAMMSPQTMAVITRVFPPTKRGVAMAIWGAVAGIASLVGPIAGGVLIDGLGWEWIFFINVPVGVFGFLMVQRYVPELERHRHRFDWLGVALSGLGLFLIVFGLEEGNKHDWGTIVGPISVWILIGTGVLLMILFVVWQRFNRGEPLVPLDLFGDRNFSVANLGIFGMGIIITSMVFPMTLFAQSARGLTPTQAALLTLPLALVSGALAPVVGKLIDRKNPKWFAVAGFATMVVGLVVQGLMMRPGHSILWLLIPSAILGVANAGIWGPLSVSATRNLPPKRAGAGSGVYNTTRQIGAVLGSAAIAAFMTVRLEAEFPPGVPTALSQAPGQIPAFLEQAFSLAMGQSMLLPAAAAVLGVIAALLLETPQPQPRATQEEVVGHRSAR